MNAAPLRCSDDLYGDVKTACQSRWPSQKSAIAKLPPTLAVRDASRVEVPTLCSAGINSWIPICHDAHMPAASETLTVEPAACPPLQVPFQASRGVHPDLLDMRSHFKLVQRTAAELALCLR